MFEPVSTSTSATADVGPGSSGGPGGFAAQLRAEFGRLARPPREDLSILALNGLAVVAGWFLLPDPTRDWLFERHGTMAFAVVLETWMLADTPATNVLGNDVPTALAALPDGARLRRLLRVKVTALACVVGLTGAVACLATAWTVHRYAAGLATAAALLVLPFGTAAVSTWLGLLLPYHRRHLRWRWARRREWRGSLRWVALVLVPYSAVPALYGLLAAPAAVVWTHAGRRGHGHVPFSGRLLGWLTACLVAGLVYLLATRAGARLAAHRARALQGYLADPDRG
jgi:hypothetical protein